MAMANLATATLIFALALDGQLSTAAPTEPSASDCTGPSSTCQGATDLAAAVEGDGGDADAALHLLQRKTTAASERSVDDAGPAKSFSNCPAYAKCRGCSGEACSYCHQEADLECCLDMQCHGCSGESCSHCRNENLAKCCSGAPMHVRKCSAQQSSHGHSAHHGHHGHHGQHGHGHHGHGHHTPINAAGCDCSWIPGDDCKSQSHCAVSCRMANKWGPCTARR